jgi:transcriptional regulator with XRE-family HTH domain
MRCQARRWAHSTDPRHETEQRGYDLIGAMLKRRRVLAGLTQRELERLTRIDQTVISRLENGRQYGLRWSRFAILVATLDGLDDATAAPPPPWWVRMGITPPPAFVEQLRDEGLLPPGYDAEANGRDDDGPSVFDALE